MNTLKIIQFSTCILLFFAISSCQSDDSEAVINLENTEKLSDIIANRTVETGAVIACAASDANNSDIVNVYYYLEEGASNVQFFETNTANVDKNDYTNYRRLAITSTPLFEGYIEQFTRSFGEDQWVIVTYELNDEIKLSNPIRTKNISKPTVWTNEITINQETSKMPLFSWEHNTNGDNAIYFQIVSTVDNGLLSGTYTNENKFQYYDTSNVVLNISEENPIDLTINNSYKFTLMDVSADNWVNTVIQDIFVAQ
ncbi:hypothetical protein U8527_20440 [Kordia algicida OT-1]|uniref:Lipoprotein n=1 Tax=Kordia algicida OT-1 TaxID=391587 RepID=A9DKP2_9FLAO|nr:hypothetical protein [Kordia algicida]EDP98369.1 hypothetical protein KAOT1_14167 [Kordia algicida OT-1]